MKEEINFRSHYYQKAGLVGVDQRKLLDTILSQQKIDITILRETCQKYSIPSAYRVFVWKILLDILSVYRNNHEHNDELNQLMFHRKNEVLPHLVKFRCSKDTPLLERIVHFFYLQDGLINTPECDLQDPILWSVGKCVLEMFPELRDDEKYEVTRRMRFLIRSIKKHFIVMVEETGHLMHELEPELHEHLTTTQLWNNLLIENCFEKVFTGQFPASQLLRVWDKVIAGSYQFLITVAVALLAYRKTSLLEAKEVGEARINLEQLTEEASEVVINQALDLWNVHSAQLLHIGQSEPSPLH